VSVPQVVTARAVQRRTVEARRRIVEGAIDVLARAGIDGLTHRTVAAAAGASLAATTYHFDSKSSILEAAARSLLEEELAPVRRLAEDVRQGRVRNIRNLGDVIDHLASMSLVAERERSLAWLEVLLHAGRSAEMRVFGREWYSRCEELLRDIARALDSNPKLDLARTALDEWIGMLMHLHPLRLERTAVRRLLEGSVDPEELIPAGRGAHASESDELTPESSRSRGLIVEAALEVALSKGIGAISYRAVTQGINMARSAPGYYFPTIDALLEATEVELLKRAKVRYRSGLGAWAGEGIDAQQLTDFSVAVLFREMLEFRTDNLASFELWLRVARTGISRDVIANITRTAYRGWRRRFEEITGGPQDKRAPLRIQTLFVGKVIRAIVCGAEMELLAQAPRDVAMTIQKATRLRSV
jgi:DNA-binding transcriptional regulator YbjK